MKSEHVNSRPDLIRRMQELAVGCDVEIGGNFVPLKRPFPFVFTNRGYSLTVGTGNTNEIEISPAFHGGWHSHSPSIKDISMSWEQDRDYYEKPSQQDLLAIVCCEWRELIIVAPLHTIQLAKQWTNPAEQPIAQYIRRVREAAKSAVSGYAFSDQQVDEIVSQNPRKYVDSLAQAVSIDRIIEVHGGELALHGNRFPEVWAEFSSVLGLEVNVTPNQMINPKYAATEQELKRMLPVSAATYAHKPGAGRTLYQKLADADSIRKAVDEAFQKTRK